MAKNSSDDFVLRPFEGLPGEPDWVAFREIVPAATGTARTVKEHGGVDVVVVTMLPGGYAAMHRPDGTILLALQGALSSTDLSRDLAGALLEAIDAEPGTAIVAKPAPGGPRLQDVLDLRVAFEVTVHDDYDFWVDGTAERTAEVEQSLTEAAESTIPTVRLASVEHAYWCDMGKQFLRWVRTEDEDAVVDALARLHAQRVSALALADGGQARFLGMFRAAGLVVPVWELPKGVQAADVEQPAAELGARLDAALAVTEPLDANERRARAGIVSRQVTLR
ncbi:hypothetical protein Xcel_3246 [Xylanimonas cellulosilytica DSM 15894]|uniref:DUF5926 domain-containing protein n=1 Tax=Xylanimonas cellulosilytica (strain DSM 15894 / JCM 12276 / CECT 5975 / KCTC 9989 / LMG 20990 / NBRC 107835 / XIL07) TaxID=446471 RepID=D1C0P3_XYLCX|nr:DUF5926 family protein [Xylanimonas cellulosilytica]ACZ32246.1 hypothetical protein Xcel_3246 [Xylanimonas cellulosilytica DSM 15894]